MRRTRLVVLTLPLSLALSAPALADRGGGARAGSQAAARSSAHGTTGGARPPGSTRPRAGTGGTLARRSGARRAASSRLGRRQIAAALKTVDGWTQQGGAIAKQRRFASFAESMRFVNQVARLAEAERHHPDITIRYNRVSLSITNHEAGGLTRQDFDLARQIDALAE